VTGTADRTPWKAQYQAELRARPVDRAPSPADPEWKPLRQAWRPAGPEPRFQPAWARLRWNERGLLFDLVLTGPNPRNAARSLNERTWELGDIAEIFLQQAGSEEYFELHVTPENQRLQLRWTTAGFAAFRRDLALFPQFTVADPHWIESASVVRARDWSVSAYLPAAMLGLGTAALSAGTRLQGAVCRYDCTTGEAVHSATAPLTEAAYHRRAEWDSIVLCPAP
jgi:hypothetical protein